MEETLHLEGLHFDVIEATLKSIATKTITPIVKEELKLKIQSSRLAAGKAELPTPLFKEPEKYTLTQEELEKRKVKRERNRVAAEKCRLKKKVQNKTSVQELDELVKRNKQLKDKLAALEGERNEFLKSMEEVGINVHGFLKVEESCDTMVLPAQLQSPSTSSAEYTYIPTPSPDPTAMQFTERLLQTATSCAMDFNQCELSTINVQDFGVHPVHTTTQHPVHTTTQHPVHTTTQHPVHTTTQTATNSVPNFLSRSSTAVCDDSMELPPQTQAQCVQIPTLESTPLPQTLPPYRRASYDVGNDAMPQAPPFRRYSADPCSLPSTSTSGWWDMPEQLCTTDQHSQSDIDYCNKLFEFEDDFSGLSQLDDDLDELMKDEEEALVPGHNFENIRESPSFY